MGSLKLVVVTAILYLSVSTSAPVLGKKVPNLPEETNTSKDNNDKFETLPKLQGSSETKSRTLLDDNLMNVTEEDDEDLAVEGSGEDQLAKDKKESNLDENDDYLDDDDYYDDEEEEDDEDIYDDEDEDYSGDYADDDEDYDYDDEDYEEEEDYLNKGIDDLKRKKESSWVRNDKNRLERKKENVVTPKPKSKETNDEDLHFADDDITEGDLNLSEDEEKSKIDEKNNGILYEYYNEFFKEDEEDYEEEDLHPPVGNFHPKDQRTGGPSRKEKTIPSSIPAYLANLTTSHILLMAASAIISFILFTIAFIVCCHQRRQRTFQKKKCASFVIDSNYLVKTSQKSHHPSNFVTSSSTSIVKSYQRVPTSTKEFLSSDSTTTSCSGIENPHHSPDFTEAGSSETKKPLLP